MPPRIDLLRRLQMMTRPHQQRALRLKATPFSALVAVGLALILSACARQVPEAISAAADVPGFWWGLWHGFIFPFSWIGSLVRNDVAVYAVPNSGGWYDFGFFVGITVLGGGSWFGSKGRRRG
jgi:hypothetical protein